MMVTMVGLNSGLKGVSIAVTGNKMCVETSGFVHGWSQLEHIIILAIFTLWKLWVAVAEHFYTQFLADATQ